MITDDQLLLAAAYVDGELSDGDRARAENDPVVWAEVQRQRSVQQLAGVVPPYSHDVAQAQIARAIAAARDDTHEGATVHVLSDHRRRNRWLGGSIAAGLVLALAGAAFVGLRGGGNDTSSDAAAVEEPTAATAAMEDTIAADVADDDPASSKSESTADDELLFDQPGPLMFSDENELLDVGRIVIARAALLLLEPTESDCEVVTESGEKVPVLADAMWMEDDRPVVLAIEPLDDLTFRVIVADPEDCSILMSVSGSFDR